MNDALMYFLEVNIAIALFYLFYRLFFAGDTFWKTRRYYMLFSILLSFVYPFLSVESWLQKQEPVQKMIVNYATLPEFTVTAVRETTIFSLENISMAIYGLVVLTLLVRLILQLASILRIRLHGTVEMVQNTRIIAIEKEVTPFSFFRLVFMNPELHNERETKEILAHELTHVRQGHSFDVLVSEFLTIILWLNPATWLLKREIRQNLEFLADNKVLESGFDSQTYQYHLLQLSYQTPEHKLGNKFNVSPLKKRIIMMNQKKSAKASLLKYSLIVPLALALVVSSNAQTVINKAKKALTTTKEVKATEKKALIAPAKSTETVTDVVKVVENVEDEKTWDVVEKMPQYPGGEQELMGYLGRNIRYPVIAQQNNIQGKVIASFIVSSKGKVINPAILRSVDPSLDKEAIRVISTFPEWIPGEQNGKKVATRYTIPVIFRLEDDAPTPAPALDPNENPIIVVGYGKQTSGSVPKVKEFDPNKPPVFVVDGKIQAKNFNVKTIDANTIERVDVNKPDKEEEKARLVAKYGEDAANGVIKITLKD
jgi:TonB family protein